MYLWKFRDGVFSVQSSHSFCLLCLFLPTFQPLLTSFRGRPSLWGGGGGGQGHVHRRPEWTHTLLCQWSGSGLPRLLPVQPCWYRPAAAGTSVLSGLKPELAPRPPSEVGNECVKTERREIRAQIRQYWIYLTFQMAGSKTLFDLFQQGWNRNLELSLIPPTPPHPTPTPVQNMEVHGRPQPFTTKVPSSQSSPIIWIPLNAPLRTNSWLELLKLSKI